jgi:hypothetical protein
LIVGAEENIFVITFALTLVVPDFKFDMFNLAEF